MIGWPPLGHSLQVYPVAHWQLSGTAFIVASVTAVYSDCASYLGALVQGSCRQRSAGARKTGLDHVGTVPSVRKIGGYHYPGEEISGAGAQFAFALLPIHQPGNDSVWTILLEPGMPILPGVLSVAGR